MRGASPRGGDGEKGEVKKVKIKWVKDEKKRNMLRHGGRKSGI